MVKAVTGAKKVITEALLIRSVLWSEQDALATHAGHGNDDKKPQEIAEEQQQKAKETQQANLAFPQFIGFSPSQAAPPPPPKSTKTTPPPAPAPTSDSTTQN
jgi:hypothetical protein